MDNVNKHDESRCYGCGTCKLVCPQKCITMEENKRGFLMPSIDEKKCIKCGLCLKNCPYEHSVLNNEVSNVYAAKTKNKNILNNSTSGGIFTEIALAFLNTGAVAGAVYDNDLTVEHIVIHSKNELNKLMGSKYVQSKSYSCYETIKKELEAGKRILFSGTGCQIAGLKCYLKKEYQKLYTIEIACHGVPSPGFFKSYLKYLEFQKNIKITDYKFRTKNDHKVGEHYKLHIITQSQKIIKKYANLDPYYGTFLDGTSLRKSCYSCKFKGKNRIGDILLSDYWGIEKCEPSFDCTNGVSAVHICSKKGEELFNSIKNNIDYISTTYEKATKYNKSVLQPTNKIENNEFDWLELKNNPNVIKEIRVKNRFKKSIKNLIPEKMKMLLKKYIKP